MENRSVLKELRVLFVAQEEVFYSRPFFEKLLDSLPPETVAGVVLCPLLGKKSRIEAIKEMYRFCGPMDFVRLAWRYTRKRMDGRSLEEFLQSHGIPVFRSFDISGESFVSLCERIDPDAIVAVSMPGVFGDKVLRMPKLGCLSIHHSPVSGSWDVTENFWRMYYGRKSTEIAVYRMNSGHEAEIILRDEVSIWLDESLDNLLRRIFRRGAGRMLQALERLRNDAAERIFNFEKETPAFGLPGRTAVQEFRRRGKRLL